jgi:hypothetical protein
MIPHTLIRLTQEPASAFATLLVAFALVGGLAIWAGAVPPFEWTFATDGRRFLMAHNEPNGPSCPTASAYVDCARRSPGRREFYARYGLPDEARLLILFERPNH